MEKQDRRRQSLIDEARAVFEKQDISTATALQDIFEIFVEGNFEDSQTVVDVFEAQDVMVFFNESRAQGNKKHESAGLFLSCKGFHQNVNSAIACLHELGIESTVLAEPSRAGVWFPRHITDLDKCMFVAGDVEPHKDSSHPGFSDKEYLRRRQHIAKLAGNYKQGNAIPTVDYTVDETQTWRNVYLALKANQWRGACKEYRKGLEALESGCGYSPSRVPQLQEVSEFLRERTGFRLSPVTGLLSARDFLASLAFKVFRCTQYIRHHSSPAHTPEPDCCHELLGHVPMFLDPVFAEFSQEVGLASLGASDRDIEKLATVYWFTVEFGLCRKDGQLKAFGAGLMSSTGEFKHALSNKPQHLPLDVEKAAVQPYQDADFQSVYFVASSFENALRQVREFSRTNINRGFTVRYDEVSQKVIASFVLP